MWRDTGVDPTFAAHGKPPTKLSNGNRQHFVLEVTPMSDTATSNKKIEDISLHSTFNAAIWITHMPLNLYWYNCNGLHLEKQTSLK